MSQYTDDLYEKVKRLRVMQKELPAKYEQAILAALSGGHDADKAREIADDLYGRDFFTASRELIQAESELEAERRRECARRDQYAGAVPEVRPSRLKTQPEKHPDMWPRLFGWIAGR